jgi:hypothetical protein
MIAGASVEDFHTDFTTNPRYVARTMSNVSVLPSTKKGGLRTMKKIPIFDDAIVEMAINYQSDHSNNWAISTSHLIDTDKKTRFMKGIFSKTIYQQISDDDLLVTTSNLAIIDLDDVGFCKKLAFSASQSSGIDKITFENETVEMVERNRERTPREWINL